MKIINKIHQTIKKHKLLIAIFLVALLIRILSVYSAPIKIWDESVYLNLGTDLSKNLLDYSFSHGWSDFIPSGEDNLYGFPKAGFRAPLLPYIIAFFHILHINFLINFFMPLIGALSTILIYLLGKEIFNKKTGLISALFLAFIPVHVNYSGRVLTDVLVTFLILLSFLSFWKGFERGHKKHKILFGLFFAIAVLSRYTALWLIPVFLSYLLIRNRSLKFLRDKYLWLSVLVFLITLTPWFIYGILTYNNPVGAFIHGARASMYWGGSQTWHLYFDYWWQMLSIVGFIFIYAIYYILNKKEFVKKEIYLLLIWITVFLGMVILIPHKEDRFILPIVPAITLISGYVIEKVRNNRNLIIGVITGILVFSSYLNLNNTYSSNHNINTECYRQVGSKLGQIQGEFLVVSENTSLFRNFSQQESAYYPITINEETIKSLTTSANKKVYFVFTKYNSGFNTVTWKNLNKIMAKNYNIIFACPQDGEINWIYSNAVVNPGKNLIPNNSFEVNEKKFWVTNTPAFVTIDNDNNGSYPSSHSSAKITGSSTEADLHSSLIPVQTGSAYEFRVYTNTEKLKTGELGLLIDEYSSTNKWLKAKWLGGAGPGSEKYIAALYKPESPSVSAIRIHAYLTKNSGGTAYLDNYQLYKE